MTKKYTVLVERDADGWFVSEVVGLPGCHTQAKSVDELFERTKIAIQAHLADERYDDERAHQYLLGCNRLMCE